jgi:hypothetical protein
VRNLEYIEEPADGGGNTFPMDADDIAAVTSFYADGAASLTITVTPENETQGVELFLMVGTAVGPVQARASAVAESIDGGHGEVEELTYVTSEATCAATPARRGCGRARPRRAR